MWFATVWLAPERDVAFLAVAKLGGPAGQRACDEAVTALIEYDGKSVSATPPPEKQAVQILKTAGGIRFGMMGARPSAPAPTLFVFGNEISETLQGEDLNKVGRLLLKEGVRCVSLDLPCHGQETRPDEPAGLAGWAARLRNDEDPILLFTKAASAVLDHLIADGYTDRERVAACGTSRGGFAALHFAAAEPRIRCVAAFAPVTDLIALREFDGMDQHARTNELALIRHADKFAGRPIWLCIGNHDERVDTDQAIAFTRAVVKSSAAEKKAAPVELHVMPSLGHSIHPTAHAEAAAWIAERLK